MARWCVHVRGDCNSPRGCLPAESTSQLTQEPILSIGCHVSFPLRSEGRNGLRSKVTACTLCVQCNSPGTPSSPILPMSVPLFLPACLALVGSPRVPTRSSTPRAPVPSSALRDLDEANWCEAIAGASNLAVVCFHAPWCKTCLATAPTYERIAYQFRDRADFFRCDFKKHRSLCLRERVFALPNCPSVFS